MDRAALRSVFESGLKKHFEGRLAEALEFYTQYTRHDLTNADVLNNMGVALRALGHHEAALASYRRALALKPRNKGTWSNMGNALRELGLFEEALAAHRKGLEIDGPSPSLHHNIGIVYRDLGRMDEAIQCFDRGLALDADHTNCQWDRALALLMKGDYGPGFRDYEWRWKTDKAKSRRLTDKLWDGGPLDGKTILLTTEQGFGDAIQFARFIPEVARRGGRVVVECQKELARLMACVEGVTGLMEAGAPPVPHDAQLPLLSLAGTLGATMETLPRRVPYIQVPHDPARTLPPVPGTKLKVGLVWAGKLKPRDRSCPLATYMPLVRRSEAAFYSLQMGDRRDDIRAIGAHGLIADLGQHIDDFHDMAVYMKQMDLIVTIDSGPAHLAGALGVPTWVLLLHSADWRWMLERDDCPWYPSMRLFRQERFDDWSAPAATLHAAFDAFVAGFRPGAAGRQIRHGDCFDT